MPTTLVEPIFELDVPFRPFALLLLQTSSKGTLVVAVVDDFRSLFGQTTQTTAAASSVNGRRVCSNPVRVNQVRATDELGSAIYDGCRPTDKNGWAKRC